MSDYSQRECVYCHKPLSEHDDVVVCPDCGAPYHRACYEKAGKCVLSSRHGAGFAYQAPGEAGSTGGAQTSGGGSSQGSRTSGTSNCPACGALNPSSNIFCERCGAAMRGQPYSQPGRGPAPGGNPYAGAGPQRQAFGGGMFAQPQTAPEYDGIPAAVWADYIGSSAPSYLYMFSRMDQKHGKTSLCWVSLLFAPAYFFYRKMWGWGAISLLLWLVLSIPTFLILGYNMGFALPSWISESGLLMADNICFYLNWAVSILFMLYSYYLYRRHCVKKISALRETCGDESSFRQAVAVSGGTSTLAVILLFVLLLVVLPSVTVALIGPDKVMNLYNSMYGSLYSL